MLRPTGLALRGATLSRRERAPAETGLESCNSARSHTGPELPPTPRTQFGQLCPEGGAALLIEKHSRQRIREDAFRIHLLSNLPELVERVRVHCLDFRPIDRQLLSPMGSS